jgi:hypothetical protein
MRAVRHTASRLKVQPIGISHRSGNARSQLQLVRHMNQYRSQFAATRVPRKRLPEWRDFTQEETRLPLHEGGATKTLTR